MPNIIPYLANKFATGSGIYSIGNISNSILCRTTFELPNEEEEFEMITKETNKTFYLGKLMQAQVTK